MPSIPLVFIPFYLFHVFQSKAVCREVLEQRRPGAPSCSMEKGQKQNSWRGIWSTIENIKDQWSNAFLTILKSKVRGAVKWLDVPCANNCEQLNIQLACLTLPIISLSFTSLLKTRSLRSMTWNNPNVKMLPKANRSFSFLRKSRKGMGDVHQWIFQLQENELS